MGLLEEDQAQNLYYEDHQLECQVLGSSNKKMLVKFFVRKSIVILFLVWGCNDKKINIVMLEEWKKGQSGVAMIQDWKVSITGHFKSVEDKLQQFLTGVYGPVVDAK